MKKASLLFIAASVIMLVISACSPTATTASTVVVTNEQSGNVIAEGRLYPINTLEQSFNISGEVAEVLVTDGEAVEKGQALARLVVSPEANAALARARQEVLAAEQALDLISSQADLNLSQSHLALMDAEEEFDLEQSRYDANETDENKIELDIAAAKLALAEDRVAQLESGDGIDPDEQAAAEARLASANAGLESAQAALEAFTLKSSMDGSIVDLTLQVGQRITAGIPVMTVADFSSWVVKTDNLSEIDVTSLREGQTAEIVLDALPDVTLNGEITHINSRFEEKRGDITFTVTIQLTQTDPRMRWGMTAAAYFIP